ncbi:MAG TPA: LysM peptidoglycan-binding domain-containing protein [Ktedonosporobacter sp.]|nr:LysM peptidoglycan-binding domain-containing protein [Ktedonosporobacter sp.]
MRKTQWIWQYFQKHRMASIALGHVMLAVVLGAILVGGAFGSALTGADAQSSCSSGDRIYIVANGDTLGSIAQRYQTTWQSLASYNKLANPNGLSIDQHLCIPGHPAATTTYQAVGAESMFVGQVNTFPWGVCTWWANYRYHQVHGVYVPWTTNANAWQWTTRAYEYHWNVTGSPVPGSIINLQPGVQGAYGLGHVGFVERTLPNGHVIASNMNWSAGFGRVVNAEFAPGPGVTFISL